MKAKVLCLQGVSARRGAREVLKDVSFCIAPGEHAVIFGPNGSGKSTLLDLLCGRMWPDAGVLEILGNTLGSVDLRNLRRQVGSVDTKVQMAFQRAAYTTEEVVLSGFFDSIGLQFEAEVSSLQHEQMQHTFQQLSIQSLRERIFRELSYGEQKRVLLARALVHQPVLLVLDEACSGLDMVSRDDFLAFAHTAIDACSSVWTTHHLDEVPSFVQQAILLKQGSIFFQGTTAEAFTADHLSALFGTEISVERRGERVRARVSSTQ